MDTDHITIMKPAAALPIHDPEGLVLPHLQAAAPALKELFEIVFLSVSAVTQSAKADQLIWLERDPFFRVTYYDRPMTIGEEFLTLYARTAVACAAEQIVHLCFPDRVAYALQSDHRPAFMADVRALQASETPMLFQRSAKAWRTHPQNYYDSEQMVTRTGAMLFGRSLDFAWCHVALLARDLQRIAVPEPCRDFSFFAGIILALRETIHTRDVDWLAWEDPFILARDPQSLKREREQSTAETRKRLGYVIPMLQLLNEASAGM